MSEPANQYRERAVQRALTGPGVTTIAARRAAFDNRAVDERARHLIDKVAKNAWKVTAEDVEAVKVAGVSEDEIFELTVCAALGQATRQLETALAAIVAAENVKEEKAG